MDRFQHVTELDVYAALTDRGRRWLETVLTSPPARAVGETSLRSVSGSYAGRRFPHLTDYESAGCEKPFDLLSLLDQEVIDLLAQPTAISIEIHDCRGRRKPRQYVADYLEVKKTGFTIVEAKCRRDLESLAAKSIDWHQSADGEWHFSPGEVAAKAMGMGFRVFCPDTYSPVYLANLTIIARLPNEDLLAHQQALLRKIRERVTRRPYTIEELASELTGVTGAVIYQAIAHGYLYGALETQAFDGSFLIYRDGAQFHADRQARIGAKRVHQPGPLEQRLLTATPKELTLTQQAMERYDARRSLGLGRNSTDRRDERRMALAVQEGAPRLAGFLRRIAERGGKGTPVADAVVKAINAHARAYLRSGKPPIHSKLYADYALHAKDAGLPIPAVETHRRYYRAELAPEKAACLSGGKRAFHAACPRTDGGLANARLEIAGLHVHIDGVYGDVLAATRDAERQHLRPIFYPMVDDATGYILACGVKVGRPSSIAVAMAFRDCYQRHGALPAQVYSDWGSEFVNKFIPSLSAYFGMGYERRTVGKPRAGGVGEMVNAQLSSFLQTLVGGMYFDKVGRAVDGDRKGRRTAQLSIEQIVYHAEQWMYEIWNKTPIGSRTETPHELWQRSRHRFSDAFVPVADSPLARYYTGWPIRAEAFSYQRGIAFNGKRYGAEKLAELLVRGETPTEPRLDCMNPSIIHALTSTGPIELRASDYLAAEGMSFPQRMAKAYELFNGRRRARANAAARNIKEQRLVREIEAVRPRAPEPKCPRPPVRGVGRHARPDFAGLDLASLESRSLERVSSVGATP